MADQENSLDRYLRETGEKLSAIAARMGMHPSSLTRPLNGDRDPTVSLARKFEEAVNGRVTAAEFIEICMMAKSATTAPSQPEEAA